MAPQAALGEGARKKALTVVGRPDVLVKTRVSTSTHKVRREIATRSEVMYLELNRGRRGVPRLYGGWRDAREDRVYYVVQRAGSPMVVDEVSNNSSAAWLAFCRADPVVCRRRPFYVVSTPSTRLLDGVCSMRAGDVMSARWTLTPSTRRPHWFTHTGGGDGAGRVLPVLHLLRLLHGRPSRRAVHVGWQ